MDEENTFMCKLCSKAKAKYTCPRCNVRYCSSHCYRSESHVECSEMFYHNCCMESLRSMKTDENIKYQMTEMLKKFQTEDLCYADVSSDDGNDEDADESVPDLAKRISRIDLDRNPEKVLEFLTAEEIKELEEFLKNGKTNMDIVEVWNPWWCEKCPKLLEEVSKKEESVSTRIPSLLEKIEDFDKLLKMKKPSETVAFNIINTLYGYAYLMKLYNGDHLSLLEECASSLLTLSMALKQVQFSDVATALSSCILCLSERDQVLFVSKEYSIAVIEDVLKILAGPNSLNPSLYVMAALSECHHIFRNVHKALKNERKKRPEHRNQLHLYFAVQKKLEFYLSWVKSYGSALKKAIPLVELEKLSLLDDLVKIKTEKDTVQMLLDEQKTKQTRKLIEEI